MYNDNISKLWDSNNSKYVDQYLESTGPQSSYYGNINKYGDAVYETSSGGYELFGGWDSDVAYFPIPSQPVFDRGGHVYNGDNAGCYAFNGIKGNASWACSFRPVVLSSQP